MVRKPKSFHINQLMTFKIFGFYPLSKKIFRNLRDQKFQLVFRFGEYSPATITLKILYASIFFYNLSHILF
jgi:hypothetical protein